MRGSVNSFEPVGCDEADALDGAFVEGGDWMLLRGEAWRDDAVEWDGSRRSAENHVMNTGLLVSHVISEVSGRLAEAVRASWTDGRGVSVEMVMGFVMERLWPMGRGKMAGRQKLSVLE